MRFLLLLILTIACFSCKKEGQVDRDNNLETDSNRPFTEAEMAIIKNKAASKERVLKYVLRTEDQVWGLFSDSTAYYIDQRFELTTSEVNRLLEGTPNHGYAITDKNKIWIDGETPFDLNDNSNNQWLMIDYKWMTQVEPDFEDYPDQDNIPNLGVRLLLNGYCSDDYSKSNQDQGVKEWVDNYHKLLDNINANDWYVLSYIKEDKKFTVQKTKIDTTHFYWDCGDLDMFSISAANPKEGDLAFIAGIDNIIEGQIKSHFHRQTCIQPEHPYHFVFEGVEYQLRAEGILQEDWNNENTINEEGRIDDGKVYRNYKLYLSSGGKEQLLLAIKSSSGRYVAIEFIGDLDNDGKPDFLFETSTWYEDYKKTLFLSSKANKNEFVKFVASDGYSIAC